MVTIQFEQDEEGYVTISSDPPYELLYEKAKHPESLTQEEGWAMIAWMAITQAHNSQRVQ